MRKLVYSAVKSLPASRHDAAILKAVLLPVVFFSIYFSALFVNAYWLFCLLYSFLGFMIIIIFLNLIHEVCHNNLFSSKKMNHAFLLLFDIIGANSFIWKKRHNRLHHHFTNVMGWDSDIEKSKFLKVHPTDNQKKLSRYQHWLVFIYPLFVTNWFLVRDFNDFFSKKTIVRKLGDIPLAEYFKLFFFKLFFIGYLVILPAFFTPFTLLQTLLALFILLLSAGFFALIVLLPPHVNTSNQFPVVDMENSLDQSWFMHQLKTTNDVNGYNWFTRHVMANFNFHLAHHLFPDISHVYAREVTEVISKYNKQFNLPYRSYPLLQTLKNHYTLIKMNRSDFNILEEDM